MSRGIQRERQVKAMMEEAGWLVIRAAGSFGVCDLIALRDLYDLREAILVEVKSDIRGPFGHFGPAKQKALIDAAEKAGAEPWLCWWPPKKEPEWLAPPQWPIAKKL